MADQTCPRRTSCPLRAFPSMDEARGSARHRTLRTAQIVFHGGSSVIDCVLKDLSNTGARLAVESAMGIPDEFTLTTDGGAVQRPSRVVRRTANGVGVIVL